MRKNQKFNWSDECQQSFDTIESLLCSKPILEIYDPKLAIYIYTDASIKGIETVLIQEKEI